jgi:Tfp pilus assembly protein PilF
LLGIANLELDRREAAKASLAKALLINPPAIRAHIYLANLYAKDHQFKEAADELHKITWNCSQQIRPAPI